MNEILDSFKGLLYKEKKNEAFDFILNKLKNGEIDVVTLYSDVLDPALNQMVCLENKENCIWREHIRSSIIRLIIENCYPFVVKEIQEKYKFRDLGKVLIICPPDEHHELGARMAADFFELAGYTSIFIGANTPKEDFINSINALNPKYIAISVTNPYHLFSAKEVIKKIKEKNSTIKILVGGYAFISNPNLFKELTADFYVNDFNDILALREEDIK